MTCADSLCMRLSVIVIGDDTIELENRESAVDWKCII